MKISQEHHHVVDLDDTDQIKACPFGGCEPDVLVKHPPCPETATYAIICSCGALVEGETWDGNDAGCHMEAAEDALVRWNTRSSVKDAAAEGSEKP